MAIRETITIERDGVTVQVCPRTPRTDMTLRAVLVKLSTSIKTLAKEYDVTDGDIDIAVYEYAVMCSRAKLVGQADFSLPGARDDEDHALTQFKSYLNTDYMGLVNAITDAIRKQDAPSDSVTAPTPPEDSKKK